MHKHKRQRWLVWSAPSPQDVLKSCLITWGLLIYLAAACSATTITHLTYAGHGPEWLEFLNERAEALRTIEPAITVDFMVAAGDYATRFSVMEAAGTPPDVTDFYPALAGSLITSGFFLDLAPWVQKTTSMTPNRFFATATLEAVSYNGQLWSLPIYINPRVTYYNADLFSNMGLLNPSQCGEAWTWDTWRASSRKLTRDTNGDGRNDQFGIDDLTYYLGWQQLIHQAGGRMYDRLVAPTKSQFLSSAVETAVDFARRLMIEDRVTGGDFANGTAATTTHKGPGILASLQSAPFDWDIELQPQGPFSRAAAFGIGGFQIAANSQFADAAFTWVAFLALNRESATRYVQSTGRIPPLRAVQPDFRNLVPDLPHNWTAFSRTVEAANSFTLYVLTKKSTEVNSVVNNILAKVWRGELATRIALESIHEQVNALLQE